jgi:hypothetical protein
MFCLLEQLSRLPKKFQSLVDAVVTTAMLSVVFDVLLRLWPFPMPDLWADTRTPSWRCTRLDALTELRRALVRPVSTWPSRSP